MTPARIRWLAASAALIVALLGYLSLNRAVTIVADGRTTTLLTQAVTVGGSLQHAGIKIGPQDNVVPSSLSLVSDGAVIEVHRAARIILGADGELYEEVSGERRLPVLLAHWGLTLGEGDRVLLAGRTFSLAEPLPDAAFLALELRRAVTVTVEDAGETTSFLSSAPTLGEALSEYGVVLHAGDRLDLVAESPLDRSVSVTLQRASSVNIRVGEQRFRIFSAAATVGEVLAEAGFALQGLDYSQPAADNPVPIDGAIRVVRVIETVSLLQEIVPHETVWQVDPDAEIGSTTVIQAGQVGVSASRLRVRYEDGEEISRVEEGKRVLVAPITAINGYGSNFVIRTTVIDGVEIEYWATLNMYATSYSPCRSGVEQCFYGTATSGVSVAKGVVATYKDWLLAARGVTIYVPGYGAAAFYDTGVYTPDPSRPWIDLGYSDDDWVGWSQWVTVYFTTPVPAVVPYFLYP